jgi:hypothetical protein
MSTLSSRTPCMTGRRGAKRRGHPKARLLGAPVDADVMRQLLALAADHPLPTRCRLSTRIVHRSQSPIDWLSLRAIHAATIVIADNACDLILDKSKVSRRETPACPRAAPLPCILAQLRKRSCLTPAASKRESRDLSSSRRSVARSTSSSWPLHLRILPATMTESTLLRSISVTTAPGT